MNDPSQMMNRGFGIWPPPADDPMGFPPLPRPPPFAAGAGGGKPSRMNWKGKKVADKRKKADGGVVGPVGGGVSGYNPLGLGEHQFQNRAKARRFYPKKKFVRFAPFAPRNTTSFIMRAKKAGGIASLVSPCPVTPTILPTPSFSPTREGLVDMAKEEWGVDGYGSMKGLIRLRSPNGYEIRAGGGEEEDELDEVSSDSDVDQYLDQQHQEVERRLDHDVSRFEMVYPGEEHGSGATACLLENRVDNQDTHIARLEEENFMLKERLFLMEREMGDLRRRLQLLETRCHLGEEHHKDSGDGNNRDVRNENRSTNEEASENEEGGDVCSDRIAEDCDESAGIPMRE
ncbi:unnamed protein product [Musa acuminata subsp. malaccensis]|uniref:(wild Malaysian banana) hypothetical protein n=1 Tax=Musa acuminata subsp. malaccensis TaxID=214687 RepID=A0A804IH72_MUSAM|nr:PREDICTED: uncharacterized protein LOC103978690 [Musa acuminata subsp. malaccensis]CAG1851522.1 unnamed protein product [Musa acuminata subsp. malaccensis]